MSVESALARLEKKAAQRVAALALELHAEIRENLSQKGSGRTYGSHQASAPGEPPAPDLGVLRNSVQAVMVHPLLWTVGVAGEIVHPESGSKMKVIAPALEFGSRRLAPRPFIRPALDALKARHRK